MSFNNQGETAKRSVILSGIFPDVSSISEAFDGPANLPDTRGASLDTMRAIDKAEQDWREKEKKKFYKATDGHVVYLQRNPNVSEVVEKGSMVFVRRQAPVPVARVSGGNAVRGYEYEILNQNFLDQHNLRIFGVHNKTTVSKQGSYQTQAGEGF